MADLMSLLPVRLRERPTEPRLLAHWYLAAQKPGGHLPCGPAGPGCDECWETGETLRALWAAIPVAEMTNPGLEQDARDLVTYFYGLGAMTGGSLIIHGIPGFDPALVP